MQECLRKWSRIDFVREESDCVEFAIDAIGAITGRIVENPARGQYSTEAQAARCILNYGSTFKGAVSGVLGMSVTPAFAQRGDIVMKGNNLGVCVGENSMFRTETGLVAAPTMRCECAWRIE
jgi:hypothetical protein